MLTFSISGFVVKIVGEIVHELPGHGSLVLLFGGQVTNVFISVLWPFELPYVRWSIPNATLGKIAWIMAGGILASAIVSYCIQVVLLQEKIDRLNGDKTSCLYPACVITAFMALKGTAIDY